MRVQIVILQILIIHPPQDTSKIIKILELQKKNKLKYVLFDFRHIASTVIKVLEKVADNINGEVEMNDLLVKLLELFCQIGVKIKELMEKLPKNSLKVN